MPKVTPVPTDEFWAQVDKHGPVPDYRPDLGPCWLWTGKRNVYGYGYVGNFGAHRIAYGPVPEGLQLDHLCRVRHCVNKLHLEPVTTQENSHRRPPKSHCKHGHRMTVENTGRKPNGSRYCRACHRGVTSKAHTARQLNRLGRKPCPTCAACSTCDGNGWVSA